MKRRVRVKGPGVKLNNVWCYINEEAVIDEVQYEENKDYVEVIEEIKENQETKSDIATDRNVGSNEIEEEIAEEQVQEKLEDNNSENTKENTRENEEDNESEDEELEALKDRAKELGINITHNMKKETIIKKIEEKEAETGENQNPEGE